MASRATTTRGSRCQAIFKGHVSPTHIWVSVGGCLTSRGSVRGPNRPMGWRPSNAHPMAAIHFEMIPPTKAPYPPRNPPRFLFLLAYPSYPVMSRLGPFSSSSPSSSFALFCLLQPQRPDDGDVFPFYSIFFLRRRRHRPPLAPLFSLVCSPLTFYFHPLFPFISSI